jgi:hypothetical protein
VPRGRRRREWWRKRGEQNWKEIRKGGWKEEAGTLAGVTRVDVTLLTSREIPIMFQLSLKITQGQLERFLRSLMEKIREKMVDFTGKLEGFDARRQENAGKTPKTEARRGT